MQWVEGECTFWHYDGIGSNDISVMRGVNFVRKRCHVTHEWPLILQE